MPTARKAPANRLPRVSLQRQKSKPKFEVPQEAGFPPVANWVYRTSEAAAPAPTAINAKAVDASNPHSFVIGSFEVMARGFVVVGKANAVALRVMTAPFRLVSRLF